MKIVFIGPPGVGKGSQAKRLSADTLRPHISMGDMLRLQKMKKIQGGKSLGSFIDCGDLVPCEVVIKFLKDRIFKEDCRNGYYLDGFPRTLKQANVLDSILAEQGDFLDFAVEFYIPGTGNDLFERIMSRLSCSQCSETYSMKNRPPLREGFCDLCDAPLLRREDDTLSSFRKRMDIFKKWATPLLDYYKEKGILLRFNALNSIDETYADLLKGLGVQKE
ncbi:hypothetical protein AB834_07480 [PVC group bacterium (ex Bugula neritina AB1)]|nr:hypothetical protein AB834_07480 [PVC group bacterium (ex Bugula neritina AB1)]